MKKSSLISLLILSLTFEFCCIRTPTQQNNILSHLDSNNIVIYVKDSSLYLYNLNKDSTQFIMNIESGFIKFSLESLSDSVVTVGYHGNTFDSAFSKRDGVPMKCPCSKSDSLVLRQSVGSYEYDQFKYHEYLFKAFNIYSKKTWIYKSVIFKLSYQDLKPPEIKIHYMSPSGKTIIIKDSISPTLKWPFSNDPYYSSSYTNTYDFNLKYINGLRVESCEGSLYLCKKDTNELLLKNSFPVDFKYPHGNYFPDISPDGSKIVFIKMAGDFEIYPCATPPKDSGMYEIDIASKEIRTLIPQNVNHPLYSPGGRYILILRNHKLCENDKLIYEICIYDKSTSNIKLIGIGDFYTWMKPSDGKIN